MKNIWLLSFTLLFRIAIAETPADVKNDLFVGGSTREFNAITYRLYVSEPENIRLHWRDPKTNSRFAYFSSVKRYLNQQGLSITFLTNAGIFQKNGKPAGLHVEDYERKHALNLNSTAKGNFHLQPNGVFFIAERAGVMPTSKYRQHNFAQPVRLATQSGPMLIIDGQINSKFIKHSNSKHYRSGVCVIDRRVIFFKNTSASVNFYNFALFSKSLGCENALYLDGKISKFYEPDIDMLWHFMPFVGILSVTKNKD